MPSLTYSKSLFVALTGLLSLTGPFVDGQRALTEIPNPDPEYQLSKMKTAEGFEISLFASDPMIAKPTSMAFDAKGRLYVTCTPIYPHIKPGVLPSDQVVRLEDTDGDGVADKRTVFADGLLIPTAVLPTPEGVYVTNSTELLFFEDKDDDGVADSRRVLFSGFGTEDTHHIVHTLRYGPAGRIYWNQSIYTHSHVETPYGYRDLQAGGVWQLRPETQELEVYARGMWNSWGLQFDRWGQSFQSDGAGFEGIGHSFPGAAFVQSVGYDKYLRNLNPGQPKFSGLEIIDGAHFPDEWQGLIITCDFRGNRISSFKVTDSNSSYISQKQEDLVTSTHGAFRPIDLQNGPDGALYVADWYNPIIQHGEVDFRDERRDKERGRIWRITAKDRPLQKAPAISGGPVSKLLDFLKADDAFTRDHAKRELKSRGADTVLPALDNWIAQLNRGHRHYEDHLLQGLWVSQSLDAVNQPALKALLESKDFKFRAAALRVLEERPGEQQGIERILETAIVDDSPRVRNEAIQVLRKLGGEFAARQVVRVLDFPMDDVLDFSLWNALRELKSDWLPAVAKNPDFFGGDPNYLMFAIRSVDDVDAIKPLETLWQKGDIGNDDSVSAMILLAERGNSKTLGAVLEKVVERASETSVGISGVLDALRSSSAVRKVEPAQGRGAVVQLVNHDSSDVQIAAAGLIGQWKLDSAVSNLKSVIVAESTGADIRSASVSALVGIGSRDARKALVDMATSNLSKAIRIAVAAGYANAQPKPAVPLVVDLLVGLEPEDDGVALVQPYLSKTELPELLAEGLKGKELNAEVATALLRRVSTASIDTAGLQAAMQEEAGIEPVDQALDEAEMRAMVEFVETYGEPHRGEDVYRRDALLCTVCHAIGGSGGSLGPDFTSIGASAQMDYLIDSLLQPQKQIKEGFHVVMVTKKDGSVVAGKLASQNENTITLQDAADQLIEIPKSAIASQEISPISLMPPGLTQTLRKDEFADLIKFMSLLGKEGDFKVTANRYVRTFRYLDDKDGDSGYADLVRHKPMVHVTSGDPQLIWLPTYSKTNGVVPLDELSALRRQGRETYNYLQFQLDAKSPGDTILQFNDPEGLVVFVGEEEVEVINKDTLISLKPGINIITVAAHTWKRKDRTLRIEVLDAPSNAAQVQVVYGK